MNRVVHGHTLTISLIIYDKIQFSITLQSSIINVTNSFDYFITLFLLYPIHFLLKCFHLYLVYYFIFPLSLSPIFILSIILLFIFSPFFHIHFILLSSFIYTLISSIYLFILIKLHNYSLPSFVYHFHKSYRPPFTYTYLLSQY